MKAVGIKQLKARLSEYVRLAKAGEIVLITERNSVVAEIRPVNRHPLDDETEAKLIELMDKGEIVLPSLQTENWSWNVKGMAMKPDEADIILDELRKDKIDDIS